MYVMDEHYIAFPYWFFQFTALLIHGIAFLMGFGAIIFEEKAAVRGCHIYILYSVDSHARRGHVTSRMRL